MKRFAVTILTLLMIFNSIVTAQKSQASFNALDRPKNLSDSALLDLVENRPFVTSGILLTR
jgi:hypothetical protein